MFSPSSSAAAFEGASPAGDSRRTVVVAKEEEEEGAGGEMTIPPRAMIAALEGEGATNASTWADLSATKASTSVARMAFAFWVNVMVKNME